MEQNRRRRTESREEKTENAVDGMKETRQVTTCLAFADYEKKKTRKRIRGVISNTESITGCSEAAKERLGRITKAASQTKDVVTEEMLIMLECENDMRDSKQGSERERKKSSKEPNGTKKRISDGETKGREEGMSDDKRNGEKDRMSKIEIAERKSDIERGLRAQESEAQRCKEEWGKIRRAQQTMGRDPSESEEHSQEDIRTAEWRKTNSASTERQYSDEEREDVQECDRFANIRNLEVQRCLKMCEAFKQRLHM